MTIEDLTTAVAAADSVDEAVDLLVRDLARQIKATSNDQNIQKLARELAAHRREIVEAVARKPALSSAG